MRQPARYKTNYRDSIYFVFPSNYITISSTVKIYGAQFGTDKIAHFFQQGYTYYKIYNRAIVEGNTPAEANRRAVRWGRATERTYYGTLVSGVFSNGDLCANYAGMRFYQSLTQAVKIGDDTRPVVLILKDGFWTFNNDINIMKILVKPFFSKHFNEALNPSIFSNLFGLRAYVRRTVRRQACKEWMVNYPNFTPQDLNKSSEALKFWHGEDYGFTESKNFVTIANTCFGGEKNRRPALAEPKS
jgi:hypothetical protein